MLSENISVSYENNLLLASILCLLLVILFVLLLHVYARWLLAEGHLCGTSMASVFGPTARLRRSHTTTSSSTTTTTYTYGIAASFSSCSLPTKGLELKAMESIPTFTYRPPPPSSDGVGDLECAICLSVFEEKQVGRSLPKCYHAFHVDCIDMWLFCHSTCPICRAQVVVNYDDGNLTVEIEQQERDDNNDDDQQVVVEVHDDHNNGDSSGDDDQNVARVECSMLDCSLTRNMSVS